MTSFFLNFCIRPNISWPHPLSNPNYQLPLSSAFYLKTLFISFVTLFIHWNCLFSWLLVFSFTDHSLDSIKSRDITLPTKVRTVKAMVFPVVMYRYESWTIKKAERRKIDAFKLCCNDFSRVPWTARRSNQSILKEMNPEYSLEGLMLQLKLQFFGHMMGRANSLEETLMLKTLMLGKIEGRMRRGWQRLR